VGATAGGESDAGERGGGGGLARAAHCPGAGTFCRYRFPPTGGLGYRGIRGAVGLGNRFTVLKPSCFGFKTIAAESLSPGAGARVGAQGRPLGRAERVPRAERHGHLPPPGVCV
jgi:hypothetical protein